MEKSQFRKISSWIWEIPQSFRSDMRVPARVFASEEMLDEILADRSLDQLVNVATLPGIIGEALAMPDIHEGYGFPIGGVAAFSATDGVISPGGIGYDINCGVRLLGSRIPFPEIQAHLPDLASELFAQIPSGVGRSGNLSLEAPQLDQVLSLGARAMVNLGYAQEADLKNIESGGSLPDADPQLISTHARSRGHDQLGTMGAGNHFVEVSMVETIFDNAAAEQLKLFPKQIVILIHTGSRGLGHQTATDYIRLMMKAMPQYDITLPDRELACVPFTSPEGQQYFKAMSAAANFAWANRQMIAWEVRNSWKKVLGDSGGSLETVYDIAHNIAKRETHEINGKSVDTIVHRKGATRSFPDQPVLIPGSMGTGSYLLMGQPESLKLSFGSCCHGSGRRMSRTEAKSKIVGSELKSELEAQGVVIRSGTMSGLSEEAPLAYKDIDTVVNVVHEAGLAKKVARLKPVAVIKG